MFDDNKKGAPPINLPVPNDDANKSSTSQTVASPSGQAKKQEVKPVPQAPVGSTHIDHPESSGVEDMFASTDDPNVPAPGAPSMPSMEQMRPVNGKSGFKLSRLILLVVVIIGVIYFIILFGSSFLSKKKNISDVVNDTIKTLPINTQKDSPQPKKSIVDTDRDQLTDVEERKLGTNPKLVDTDGDGLSDYDEVRRYLSDPLKADTDGDGYTDGDEVKGGYSPTGPGKLFEVPAN